MSASPFPSTEWNQVVRGRDALAGLFLRYQKALRAYLLHKQRVPVSDIDDVLQGFVTSQMWEKDLLAKADPSRGKFRNLLLTALDRYVSNWIRHQYAEKRSPGAGAKLDVHRADVAAEPVKDGFDLEWARTVLNQTVTRLRESCEKAGRLDIWRVFEARLLRPILDQTPVPGYAELRRELRLESPAQAANLLTTAKRSYERILRNVIAEYAGNEESIDGEIDDLLNLFAGGA
ncbi:MAG: hypothetical protein WD768_22230 [Phycisphaeraceae bacterium]